MAADAAVTLEEGAARIADRAEARAAARAAALIEEAFPDLAVTRSGGRIEIAGQGLAARWLRDARLRWIGGLLR